MKQESGRIRPLFCCCFTKTDSIHYDGFLYFFRYSLFGGYVISYIVVIHLSKVRVYFLHQIPGSNIIE